MCLSVLSAIPFLHLKFDFMCHRDAYDIEFTEEMNEKINLIYKRYRDPSKM